MIRIWKRRGQIEERRPDFIGDGNSRATISRDPEYHDEERHN